MLRYGVYEIQRAQRLRLARVRAPLCGLAQRERPGTKLVLGGDARVSAGV